MCLCLTVVSSFQFKESEHSSFNRVCSFRHKMDKFVKVEILLVWVCIIQVNNIVQYFVKWWVVFCVEVLYTFVINLGLEFRIS